MKRDNAIGGIQWYMDICVKDGNLTRTQANRLELLVKEHFATHWRDDDSPQAERTLGVRRAAA